VAEIGLRDNAAADATAARVLNLHRRAVWMAASDRKRYGVQRRVKQQDFLITNSFARSI
jgi:hypothetical protein